MTVTLPKGFESLQPFAEKWALPTEYERAAQRRRSAPEELRSFYDAALAALPAILEAVDKYPVGKVEGNDKSLLYLALSLAEVAPHVEFYKCNPNVPFAFDETRLRGHHCGIPD